MEKGSKARQQTQRRSAESNPRKKTAEAVRQRKQKPFRLQPPVPAGYMTVQQTALYLGVTERSIYRYINEYGLPTVRPAGKGRHLIKRDILEDWLKKYE